MSAFGVSPIRAAVIRELARHPEGATSGQIARHLEAAYHTVFRHLRELEDLGLVDSDAEDDRQGQRVVYRLNRDARDHEAAKLLAYLDGL